MTTRRQKELETLRAKVSAGGGRDGIMGTVGAVALDAAGNLAAGTSTGGMTGKRWGRVGDSPIIGAGTYASNDACAVSATGHGEYFIRAVVAHEIASLVRHAGRSVGEAAEIVVRQQLVALGGAGGVDSDWPRRLDRDAIQLPRHAAGLDRLPRDDDGRDSLVVRTRSRSGRELLPGVGRARSGSSMASALPVPAALCSRGFWTRLSQTSYGSQ